MHRVCSEPEFGVRSLVAARDFFFSSPKMSRLTLGSTQPPTQWVQAFFPWGKSNWGIKLITFLHLLQRLRISGFLTLLLLCAFIGQGKFYLYLLQNMYMMHGLNTSQLRWVRVWMSYHMTGYHCTDTTYDTARSLTYVMYTIFWELDLLLPSGKFIVTNQNDLITHYFKVNGNACSLNPHYQASKQTTTQIWCFSDRAS